MYEDEHLEMAYEDANGAAADGIEYYDPEELPEPDDDGRWDDDPDPYAGTYSEE